MQPAHALLAVTGNQRTLDRTGGKPLRARGQALLPAGCPHSVFHGGLFSEDYLTLCRAHSKPISQEPILGYAPSLVQAQGGKDAVRTTPYQNMNIRSLQLHLGTCDKVEPMAERRCGYECLDDSRGTRWGVRGRLA